MGGRGKGGGGGGSHEREVQYKVVEPPNRSNKHSAWCGAKREAAATLTRNFVTWVRGDGARNEERRAGWGPGLPRRSPPPPPQLFPVDPTPDESLPGERQGFASREHPSGANHCVSNSEVVDGAEGEKRGEALVLRGVISPPKPKTYWQPAPPLRLSASVQRQVCGVLLPHQRSEVW